MNYSIIKYFESHTHKLYEVKYTDIPKDRPKNERYSWIYESIDTGEQIKLIMKDYGEKIMLTI